MRFLLILGLACCSWLPAVARAVEVAQLDGRLPLGRHAYVLQLSDADLDAWLQDPGAILAARTASLPDTQNLDSLLLRNPAGAGWQRNRSDKLQLQSPGRLSWVVLDLKYSGRQTLDAVLELTGIDGLSWQYLDPAGKVVSHADDFSKPRAGRPYFDAKAVLPLQLQPGQQLRLHIAAFSLTSPRFAALNLWDAEAFRSQRLIQHLFDGAYFGLVFALLLYCLFLFVALRQYTYLFFAAFVAASAGMIYVGSGISLVVGLQHPLPAALPATWLFQGLVGMFGSLFSIALLNIRRTNRALFILWLAVAGINLLGTPWLLLATHAGGFSATDISSSVNLVTAAWIFNQLVNLATLWHYRHHYRLVLYWFLAVTLHTWALAFWPILLNSAFNPVFAPYHYAQLATLVDTLLMAYLIAHNLRNEQASRLRAQQSAVENLRLAHDIERAKSNFVATVGHDLRSPVQAISHFTQSLKLGTDAAQHANLDKIDDNIRVISELLDGMVKLSQTEWQGLKPRRSDLSLGKLLQEMHAEFAPRVGQRGLRLHIDDTACWVSSDRVCLSQILRNLIDNALKFTEAGAITLSVSDSGNRVMLRVQDTGCGIPEAALPRIFDEFFQVPGSTTGGVGLGLSIVARLARLLDIGIEVRSTPAAGTCFELGIPRAGFQAEAPAATAAEPAPADERAPGSLQGLRVLLLGDSAAADNALATLLQRWGAELSRLDSPLALLVHLREELLLCDLILADHATCRHLLEQLQPDDAELLQGSVPLFVEYPSEQAAAAAVMAVPQLAVTRTMSPMQFRSLVQRNLRRSTPA